MLPDESTNLTASLRRSDEVQTLSALKILHLHCLIVLVYSPMVYDFLIIHLTVINHSSKSETKTLCKEQNTFCQMNAT